VMRSHLPGMAVAFFQRMQPADLDRLKEELAEALENQRRLRVELDNTLTTLQEYENGGSAAQIHDGP
jgi:hypothetical protein